nr:MAG TPA: hypothetical protein [Caudoviricetes sp.]DAS28524.1 MAG TPA: hypothetical protein [Caudoviricetes sp.]
MPALKISIRVIRFSLCCEHHRKKRPLVAFKLV